MKLKYSILSLFSAAVLFSSCEPRDNKITRPDNRVGANNAPGTQANGEKDNYKYIALLAERQVEAVELFRVLTDEKYVEARSASVKVEDTEVDGAKLKRVVIKSDLKNEKHQSVRDLELTVTLTKDENGQLQKIKAVHAAGKLPFEKTVKLTSKTDLSLKNISKTIVIEKTEDGSWKAIASLLEEINVKAGKTFMINEVNFKFTAVDGNQDVFKVSEVTMRHSRWGLDFSNFEMVSDAGTTMEIQTRTLDKCSSISGVLELDSTILKKDQSGPVYERTLTYSADEVTIKSGNTSPKLPILECEVRPTVDLGKIL
jgi:hypothetical protein